MRLFPTRLKLAHTARRWPIAALCGGFAAVLLHLQPDHVASLLEYQRSAVSRGEVWRLFTGNWVHADGSHLVFDVVAFAATAAMAERLNRWWTIGCIVVSSLFITGIVHASLPALSTYRGLSGVDAALYAFVVTTWAIQATEKKDRRALAVAGLLMSAIFVKFVYELTTGQAVFVNQVTTGTVVVPLAHCAGALVGSVCACLSWRKVNEGRNLATDRTNSSEPQRHGSQVSRLAAREIRA